MYSTPSVAPSGRDSGNAASICENRIPSASILRRSRTRIFPESDVRLIPEPVNPRHAVDRAALDEFDTVPVSPLKTLVETPVSAVKCVRVKADLHNEPMLSPVFGCKGLILCRQRKPPCPNHPRGASS